MRIAPVTHTSANDATKSLLDSVQNTMGMVPNVIATMAHSPVVTQAYLGLNQGLSGGSLDPKLQERLALAIGEFNDCSYCVSAHCALGSKAGLERDEIERARHADSDCETARAILQFARTIVERRGRVSDQDIAEVRSKGLGDREIVEILGHVALNTLTNYLNHIAGTEIDFPVAPKLARV